MKLSQLSTNKSFDVLCELSIYCVNIATDEELMNTIFSEFVEKEGKTRLQAIIEACSDKLLSMIPLLLKKHKPDVLGIVATLNETTVEEVGEQNIMVTMKQIKEIIRDKEFVDFFKSCGSTENE